MTHVIPQQTTITPRNVSNTSQIKIPQNATHVTVNPIQSNAPTSVIRISPASSTTAITSNTVNTAYQTFHQENPTEFPTQMILTTATIAYNNNNGTTERATVPKNGINSGSVHSWTTLLPFIDTPNKNQKTSNTNPPIKQESIQVTAHSNNNNNNNENGDGMYFKRKCY